jgi:HK97 family phage major capsid protein
MPANTDILDRLRDERDRARQAAIGLIESDDYDPESEAVTTAEERATRLDGQIERLASQLERQSAADALDGRLAAASRSAEQQRRGSPPAPVQRASWGEQFVRSAEYTEYRGRGSSPIFQVEAGVQHRALPTGVTDLVAAGFDLGKTTVDVQPPPAPTPLLDAIGRVQVGTNAIEFVKWEIAAGGAAVVAEKAVKPSIEFKPVVESETLDTIAVWTQLTRQMIEDAPAVRDMINNELVRDVLREEEAQTAAALAAASLPTATGTDLLAAIRVGMATVQAEGYLPNAVLLNPADWADLDVTIMAGTLNGAVIGQNFWGLTPIPSPAQTAGTAVVGDFRTAVQQYYRAQVALYITDSHADTFLSNVFTLLAERRAHTAVVRPQALVEVSAGTTP